MSLYARLKELRANRVKLIEDAGKMLTEASKANRALTAEEQPKFDKMHGDADTLGKEIATLEKQVDSERQLAEMPKDDRTAGREDRTAKPADQETLDPKAVSAAESRAFKAWVAGTPATEKDREIMQQRIAALPAEARALTVTTTGGGYTVPQDFERKLDEALKYYGGVLEAADYIDTDNGQILPYPSINDTGNVAEQLAINTGATESVDPTFGVVNFSAFMYDSGIVLVPIQLLQDSAFNMEAVLESQLKIRLGRKLNTLFTTGAGTTEPKGIVVAATAGTAAAAAAAIAYTDLVNLEHDVDRLYRVRSEGAGFMFHDSTLKAIKKLVDLDGRPIFSPGGVTGDLSKPAPDTILGYPYFVNNDMAAIGATNKSVLFGALKKYKIRRVKGAMMVRFGERYMNALQIGLMLFQRYDGNLVDAGTHPVKYLQHPSA